MTVLIPPSLGRYLAVSRLRLHYPRPAYFACLKYERKKEDLKRRKWQGGRTCSFFNNGENPPPCKNPLRVCCSLYSGNIFDLSHFPLRLFLYKKNIGEMCVLSVTRREREREGKGAAFARRRLHHQPSFSSLQKLSSFFSFFEREGEEEGWRNANIIAAFCQAATVGTRE